jgi:hypothetical protein
MPVAGIPSPVTCVVMIVPGGDGLLTFDLDL